MTRLTLPPLLLLALAAAPAAGEEALLQASEGYVSGWRATHMIDTPVRDADGEIVGEVHNLLVGPDGALRGVSIEAGGFLDIGDTHFAYPLEQARVLATDAVRVQFDEDRIDDYSMFRNLDERPVTGRNWKVTELLNDYAYLHDLQAYG